MSDFSDLPATLIAMRDHVFASMTADEVWAVSGGKRALLSSRVEKGRALTRLGARGFEIDASDRLESGEQELLQFPPDSEGRIATALGWLDRPARIRLVRHARAVLNGELRDVRSEEVVAVSTSPHCSIVCTIEQLNEFGPLLDHSTAGLGDIDDHRRHPIEWANGTSAVLMHELVGHPAERGVHDLRWPEWLSVVDRPGDLMGSVDDCGEAVQETELTRGGGSLPWRRSSFRDAPMKRMCSTSVSGGTVTALLPEDRIRIRLLSGGRYEPLRDRVILGVAVADWVSGASSTPLAPFTIEERRHTVVSSLVGECGPEATYPGVICFDEGQRVYVPSRGCGLLTRPFAEDR